MAVHRLIARAAEDVGGSKIGADEPRATVRINDFSGTTRTDSNHTPAMESDVPTNQRRRLSRARLRIPVTAYERVHRAVLCRLVSQMFAQDDFSGATKACVVCTFAYPGDGMRAQVHSVV